MRKVILFLLTVVLGTTIIYAKPVNVATARKAATTFIESMGRKNVQLVDYSSSTDFTEFYTFTFEHGFILISGDDCVRPVLAYSLSDDFTMEGMPEAVHFWLTNYERQIAFYRERENANRTTHIDTSEVQRLWLQLLDDDVPLTTLSSSVSPLLTTTWDQAPYYNAQCPPCADHPDNHSGRALTGCAATSTAQIMKYWHHPTTGLDTHGYNHPLYGRQFADFGNTTYNWNLMPNSLDALSTPSQVDAVATLMYHVGVAMEMNYGPGSSGASTISTTEHVSAEDALRTYFRYSSSLHSVAKSSYTTDNWNTLLRIELDNERPVLYRATDPDYNGTPAGHSFVVDGYDINGNFHINWGWGGWCNDAYYTMGSLNPSDFEWNTENAAVVGIEPIICLAPSNLYCHIVTDDMAQLRWSQSGSATSWTLQYGTNSNFTAGTYTEVTVNNVPSKTINGLPHEATYYARVKANCSANTTSDWSNTCSFTTLASIPEEENNCTGITGTVYYNVKNTNIGMVAEITYWGSSYTSHPLPDDYYSGYIVIPPTVNYQGNDIPVTSIGDNAFRGRSHLTGVCIPSSVTYIGNNAFYGCTSLTNINLPSTVTSIGTYVYAYCTGLTIVNWPSHFSSIPSGTFSNCTSLSYINIPQTTTSIGSYAFYGCNHLSYLSLPSSLTTINSYAFYGCTQLTEITIPQTVTTLYDRAFMNCTNLTTLNWNPQNISYYKCPNSYGNYTYNIDGTDDADNYHPFKGCTALRNINIGPVVQNLPMFAFYGLPVKNVTFGNDLTSLPSYCFYNCDRLDSIDITAPITSFGNYTFAYCDSLKSVYFPNTLASIGNHAFYNCVQLVNVPLPNQLTSIYNHAFYGCSQLQTITIPQTVTSISDRVFMNCTNLTTLNWNPQSISYYNCPNSYGNYTYNIDGTDDADNYHPFKGCTALRNINIGPVVQSLPQFAFYGLPVKNVTFGNQLTSLPIYCFYNCDRLDSIDITAPITSLGNYAFAYCDSLKSVFFPNTLTSIGNHAFYNCVQLVNVPLPNQLSSIYNHAFCGCSQLQTITIPQTVTSISDRVFMNCTNLTTLNWNPQSISYYNCPNSYGNYTYNIDGTDDADNYHPFKGCSSLRDINIGPLVQTLPIFAFYELPVKNVTFGNDLTSLPSFCFYNCDRLDSIDITAPITGLGSYSFYGCDSLKRVIFPSTLTTIWYYAFANCTQLSEITIPQTVTTLYDRAFMNCTNLTTLNWNPQNISYYKCPNSYGNYTYNIDGTDDANNYHPFKGCTSLRNINIGPVVQALPQFAFYNLPVKNVTFGNQLTTIPAFCFYNCDRLDSINITAPITLIEWYAFYSCDSLKHIGLPNTLTTIDNDAFHNCTQLAEISLPSSLTTIYYYAFCGCTKLSTITIPQTVTTLYDRAFMNCTNLTTLNWNPQNISYYKCPNSYGNYTYNIDGTDDADNYHPFKGCTALRNINIGPVVQNLPMFAFYGLPVKNVTFGNDLTSLPSYCFYNCDRLISIVISQPVTVVGSYAFYDCDSLLSATLPVGLTAVNNYAFSGCSQLLSVTFPESVTSIGQNAYSGCSGFTTMSTLPLNPPSVHSTSFSGVPTDVPIIVRCVAKARYQNASVWSNFTNYSGFGVIPDTTVVASCDNYTWRGTTYNTSGVHNVTRTHNGCDSVLTLILTINESSSTTENIDACNSYAWHGTTYTASTQGATYTTQNSVGCDSVVTLNLTILPNYTVTYNANGGNGNMQSQTSCSSEELQLATHLFYRDGYAFMGWALSPNGSVIYQDNALVTLSDNMTLYAVWVSSCSDITSSTTQTACDNYYWRGYTYTASGTYSSIVNNVIPGGCDSVYTLTLTVNSSSTATETVSACNSFTWNGTTYTASTQGVTYTTQNSVGCDSVVTLNLTILPNYTVTYHANGGNGNMQSQTSCSSEELQLATHLFYRDGYAFMGWALSPNGSVIYQDNALVTLSDNLTLYAVWMSSCSDIVDSLSIIACDEYYWRGLTYMVSGTYSKTVQDAIPGGCDSVYLLNLTINHSSSSIDSVTACDSYTWHGNTYTYSTHSPSITTINASGCDSVITLYLTIHYSASNTETFTTSGSFTWHGNTYTESGTYQWHGLTSEGCDSTVTLILTIKEEGIDEADNSAHNISLYPNPTDKWVTVEGSDILSVEVIDAMGRKMMEQRCSDSDKVLLNLSPLPNGTYTLRVTTTDGVAIKRVVKGK